MGKGRAALFSPLVSAFATVKAPPAWESGYREQGGPMCELHGLGRDEYGELVPTLSRRKASRCPQTIRFPLTPISCGAGAGLFREEPLALSAASRCSQPWSWPSWEGEAVVLPACGYLPWVGGSVWNCKDEFFRPGRVGHRGCLHAAGRPLAQWSNTFL